MPSHAGTAGCGKTLLPAPYEAQAKSKKVARFLLFTFYFWLFFLVS
jgi:hypothetical protein